ncbi:bacteriophage abortive infection AbiH family protein [Chitinimonas sp. PSY-7]|uniref:AbiH family protein n=1 Tax=Chitinimonas sp. PSY-7 TaxID=3459088 RepID=UPI00403FFFFF
MKLSQTLYIIGNGFDRHHNIPSNYSDFGGYLKTVDSNTYREIENYFGVDDKFWWQFEENLANFDADTAIDGAMTYLMPYGAEDWSDSGHHDYQYELDRVVTAISGTMRNHFADWIQQLPIPEVEHFNGDLLPLSPHACYLNFNYTQTLQQTYRIPDQQILHIHGNASNPTNKLILGHGWIPKPHELPGHGIDPEEADTRILEGYQIVNGYFSSTFKPTNKIIEDQQPFFRSLRSVRQIFVMGHSLSEVDFPYLSEIIEKIDKSTVTWKISYHEDPTEAQNKFAKLNVDESLATFARMNDIDQWSDNFSAE